MFSRRIAIAVVVIVGKGVALLRGCAGHLDCDDADVPRAGDDQRRRAEHRFVGRGDGEPAQERHPAACAAGRPHRGRRLHRHAGQPRLPVRPRSGQCEQRLRASGRRTWRRSSGESRGPRCRRSSTSSFSGINLECATVTDLSGTANAPLNACDWYNADAFGLFVDYKSSSLSATQQLETSLLTAMTK